MKLRYWVLMIALILLIGMGGVHYYLTEDAYQSVDMVDINDRYTRLSREMRFGHYQRKALQEKYGCQIVLMTDEEYGETVNNAIVDQKILLDYIQDDQVAGKLIFPGQQEKLQLMLQKLWQEVGIVFLLFFLVICGALLWIYLLYLRPFVKLQHFAQQISKGNLDVPLTMKKQNYFGAFTESFDIMREELKRARQGEYEANRSKKELVAGLSHDIKTPIATIKALCEILMIQVHEEAVLKKIHIIDQKANMIDTLITDMFHVTLEDLQALKTVPREELSTIIQPMFEDINHYGRICLENTVP